MGAEAREENACGQGLRGQRLCSPRGRSCHPRPPSHLVIQVLGAVFLPARTMQVSAGSPLDKSAQRLLALSPAAAEVRHVCHCSGDTGHYPREPAAPGWAPRWAAVVCVEAAISHRPFKSSWKKKIHFNFYLQPQVCLGSGNRAVRCLCISEVVCHSNFCKSRCVSLKLEHRVGYCVLERGN